MNIFGYMAGLIREDEGLVPLTYREVLSMDGETVFVMADVCNYGVIKSKENLIDSDGIIYDLHRYGIDFYAYRVRPYKVGLIGNDK